MGVLPYCSVRLVQRGFKDGHNQLTRPEEQQKKTKHDLQDAGVLSNHRAFYALFICII